MTAYLVEIFGQFADQHLRIVVKIRLILINSFNACNVVDAHDFWHHKKWSMVEENE